MKTDRRFIQLFSALMLLAAPAAAQGQPQTAPFPRRLVSLTVPYQAGGIADSIARKVADKLQKKYGQTFVVENRQGASGSIGSNFVFRAAADGYTLLSSPSSPLIVNQFVQKSIPYEPDKFQSIAFLATAPLVLVVRSDFPASNMQEFIAYIRANEDKVNYASNGVGGSAHVGALLLMKAAGIRGLAHIPYNGASPALLAILTGDAQFYIDSLSSSLPYVQDGKMRILAVGSAKRSPFFPQTPTFEEAGYPGLILTTWFGLFAPPQTPAAIIQQLNRSVVEVLRDGDIEAQYDKLGLETSSASPEEMTASIKADRARWGAAIEDAKIPKN